MALSAAQNQVDLAMSHEPKLATPIFEASEKEALARNSVSDNSLAHAHGPVEFEADLEGEEPTEEELSTLQRVSGKIPWIAFTVAFVELCERFGYYGCSVVCMFPLICSCPMNTDVSHRHQLHPASAAGRSPNRQGPFIRGSTWCSWHGTASIDGYRSLQPVLVLHDSDHWCHHC